MALPKNYIKAQAIIQTPDRRGMINVLWYKLPDVFTGDQSTANNYCTTLDGSLAPKLKPVLSASSEYLGVALQMSLDGVVWNAVANGNQGPGDIVADELPSYAAAVIQKRTGLGGKSGRGRWYVSGIPDTLSNEGLLTNIARALYGALATQYIAPIVVGADSAIAHHYSAKGKILLPITSIQVVAELGTQRRRRLRPTF